MRILKIKYCGDCKFNDFYYDTRISLGRFNCRHPDFITKYRVYKIINRKIALKGEIPKWCPLEDYNAERSI